MTLFKLSNADYVVLETIIRARVVPPSASATSRLELTCVYNVTIEVTFEYSWLAHELLNKVLAAMERLHQPSEENPPPTKENVAE